jgi:hypothetical protein
MKTTRFATLAAVLGVSSILVSGCSNKEKVVETNPAVVAPAVQPTPLPVVRPGAPLAAPAQIDASAAWDAISGLGYDQKASFVAGVAQMESLLASQIEALKAKRATMTTNTTDWDLAMGPLTDARNYLHSMGTEVNNVTTPDAWDQEKERVHQAWVKAQDAYDKVRTTTTS